MAFETEIERLVVRLIADTKRWTEGFTTAEREAIKFANKVTGVFRDAKGRWRNALGRFTSQKGTLTDEVLGDVKNLRSSAVKTTFEHMTPSEKHLLRMANYNKLLKEGLITAETFARASQSSQAKLLKDQEKLFGPQKVFIPTSALLGSPLTKETAAARDKELAGAAQAAKDMATLERLALHATTAKPLPDQALKAAREMDALIKRLGHNAINTGYHMQNLGRGMMWWVSVPIVGAATGMTKAFADFEYQLLTLKAVAQPTTLQLQNLEEAALSMSESLRTSPTEIAKVFNELAKAGESVDSILGGAAKTVVEFAHVAGVDAARSAIIVSESMNIFNESAQTVANTLSAAADTSTVHLSEIITGFSQASAVARDFGFSMRETAAAIGILGNQGIKGGRAGTALRVMLTRLKAPSDDASEIIARYNVQLRDSEGFTLGFADTIGELQEKLGKLNPIMRDFAIKKIFGDDAQRAVSAFFNTGVPGIEKFMEEMRHASTVTEKFDILMSGTTGTWAEFTSTLSRLSIEIGRVLSNIVGPLLTELAQMLRGLVDDWKGMSEGMRTIIISGIGVIASFGPLLLIIGKITTAIGAGVVAWKTYQAAMAMGGAEAAAASIKMGLLKTNIALLGVAIGVGLIQWIYKASDAVRNHNKELERYLVLTNKIIAMEQRRAQNVLGDLVGEDIGTRAAGLEQGLEGARDRVAALEGQVKESRKALEDYQKAKEKALLTKLGVTDWSDMLFGDAEAESLKGNIQGAEQQLDAAKDTMNLFTEEIRANNKQIKEWEERARAGSALTMEQENAISAAMEMLSDSRTETEKYNEAAKQLHIALDLGAITAAEYFKAIDHIGEAVNKNATKLKEMIEQLEKEAEVSGMSEAKAKAHEAALLGATKQEQAYVMGLVRTAEEGKKALEVEKEAKKLMEEHASVSEKLTKKEAELRMMRDKGLISTEVANKEFKKFRKEVEKPIKIKMEGIDALEAGTAEAFAFILRSREQLMEAQREDELNPFGDFGGDGAGAGAGGVARVEPRINDRDLQWEKPFWEESLLLERQIAAALDRRTQDRPIFLQPAGVG